MLYHRRSGTANSQVLMLNLYLVLRDRENPECAMSKQLADSDGWLGNIASPRTWASGGRNHHSRAYTSKLLKPLPFQPLVAILFTSCASSLLSRTAATVPLVITEILNQLDCTWSLDSLFPRKPQCTLLYTWLTRRWGGRMCNNLVRG